MAVVFNHIPAVKSRLRANAAAQVRRSAAAVAADARARAPVDEGDLHDGIVVADVGGGRVQVQSTDHKSNWVEHGTVNMAPQPFLTPAAEAERQRFVTGMGRVL